MTKKQEDRQRHGVVLIIGILYLIIVLSHCGCAHYTPREKLAFGVFVGSQVADGASTIHAINHGGLEANPLLDDRPSDEQVILLKAGSVGLCYLLGEIFPEQREGIYWIGSIVGFGAAGWNYSQF